MNQQELLTLFNQPKQAISRTEYKDAIQAVTPETWPITQLIDTMCQIDSTDHEPLIRQLFLPYVPSYQIDKPKDPEMVFLHGVDAAIRQEDVKNLNQWLHASISKRKELQKPIDSPIVNTVMSLCVLFSGIHDTWGLSYALAPIENTIGFLPIDELETYDDDPSEKNASPEYATAAFIRWITFVLVFFGQDTLQKMLDILTQKSPDNAYELESLWIQHSDLFMAWFHKRPVSLYASLKQYIKTNEIETKTSFKMILYTPTFPTVID